MSPQKLALIGSAFLLSISCSDSTNNPSREVRGDPQIVATFNFAKAWEEAQPTTGQIIQLNEWNVVGTSLRYARSSHNHITPSSGYDFLDQIRDSSNLRPVPLSVKAIVNDLGDTIFFSHTEQYNPTGLQTSDAIVHIGVAMIYSHTTTYGAEGSMYLTSINGKPYDLMNTMKSTYRSIKYLKATYPDSAIPFRIFENSPQ